MRLLFSSLAALPGHPRLCMLSCRREVSHNECQTPKRIIKDQEVQLKSFQSTETQTCPPTAEIARYGEEALASFLGRVAPLILEEMEIIVDLTDIEEGDAEEESTAVRLETLTALAGAKKKITSMSWSSTGGTLAVAAAFLRHDSWCNHDGQMAVYTTALHRPAPPRIINTSACVTAVQFHPWEPSVLAAGFYNGEVIIRDLRREDDWAARESQVEHESHVVYVGWSGTINEALCVSAGADGKMLLRKYGHQSRSLTVLHRFLITNSYLNQKHHDRNDAIEITAVAAVDGDSCITGVAGGGLYLARLAPLSPLVTHPGYHDPVIMVYKPHRAVITAICKANANNLFATVSCDGELRVYAVKEAEPKHVIHMKGCLLDVFWTEIPTVVGVCGIKNKVEFIRTSTGQLLNINLDIDGKQEATKAKIKAGRNVVAVGDSDGKVELWRVVISKRTG